MAGQDAGGNSGRCIHPHDPPCARLPYSLSGVQAKLHVESNLDPGRWARSCALFERAVELAATDRARFLDRVCGDDPAMKRLVGRMLDADAATLNAIDRMRAALDSDRPTIARP